MPAQRIHDLNLGRRTVGTSREDSTPPHDCSDVRFVLGLGCGQRNRSADGVSLREVNPEFAQLTQDLLSDSAVMGATPMLTPTLKVLSCHLKR